MNLLEFQTLSKRTMPFNGEPSNPIEFENMLGNYAMGIVGEALELDYATRNVPQIDEATDEEFDRTFNETLKEMGDELHYAVGLLACLGEVADESKLTEGSKGGKFIAGDICEIVKKHIYHRHDLDRELLIGKIYNVIFDIYRCADIFIADVMQMNINKLKTRYPDKFTVEDSIKRVDVEVAE